MGYLLILASLSLHSFKYAHFLSSYLAMHNTNVKHGVGPIAWIEGQIIH